jgi:Flp pilus assembly protein TadG
MKHFRKLLRDNVGLMAVESAIAIPILLLMALGSFQVSTLVARQAELQAAAAEAEQIAMAAKPDTNAKLVTLRSVLKTSTGLGNSGVSVAFRYRCGTGTGLDDDEGGCGSDHEWTFVRIRLSDTFEPFWTSFGVGSNVPLSVVRTVQIS